MDHGHQWPGADAGQEQVRARDDAVRDANGQPVAAAVVTGQWSGARTGASSGTTASNGTVAIESAKLKTGGTTTLTVTGHHEGRLSLHAGAEQRVQRDGPDSMDDVHVVSTVTT
jgi:hypothetical protein